MILTFYQESYSITFYIRAARKQAFSRTLKNTIPQLLVSLKAALKIRWEIQNNTLFLPLSSSLGMTETHQSATFLTTN